MLKSRCNAVPPRPASGRRIGAALAVVARIENDEAAFLHVGVDLGDCRVGKRFGRFEDRPIENRIEGDLVLGDVDRCGFAGLDGGSRLQDAAESCSPARLVSSVSRSPLMT